MLPFAVVGILAVVPGGRVRVDVGGLIMLFVIGGVIGLIALAIYKRGRRDDGDR